MKALIFGTWDWLGNPKKKNRFPPFFHFHHVTISFWCYVSECLLPYKAFVEVKWISAKRPNGFLWTGTWLYIPNAWNFPSIHGSPWSNIRPSPAGTLAGARLSWFQQISTDFMIHHLEFLGGRWTGSLIWSSRKHLQRSRQQGQINLRINNSKLTVSHLKRTEQHFAVYAPVLLWKLRVHDLLPNARLLKDIVFLTGYPYLVPLSFFKKDGDFWSFSQKSTKHQWFGNTQKQGNKGKI